MVMCMLQGSANACGSSGSEPMCDAAKSCMVWYDTVITLCCVIGAIGSICAGQGSNFGLHDSDECWIGGSFTGMGAIGATVGVVV